MLVADRAAVDAAPDAELQGGRDVAVEALGDARPGPPVGKVPVPPAVAVAPVRLSAAQRDPVPLGVRAALGRWVAEHDDRVAAVRAGVAACRVEEGRRQRHRRARMPGRSGSRPWSLRGGSRHTLAIDRPVQPLGEAPAAARPDPGRVLRQALAAPASGGRFVSLGAKAAWPPTTRIGREGSSAVRADGRRGRLIGSRNKPTRYGGRRGQGGDRTPVAVAHRAALASSGARTAG